MFVKRTLPGDVSAIAWTMPAIPPPRLLGRNIVGKRLREARRKFQPSLTQDQLSGRLAAVGVQLDRVAISKIESGMRAVFDHEVRALALALNVDVRWLLGMLQPGKSRGI